LAGSEWKLSLKEVLKATSGKSTFSGDVIFTGIATDSRKALTGQLFLALVGDRFDAHQFLSSAIQQGTAGVLVHKTMPELEAVAKKIPVIQVADTLKALQSLGHYWRQRWKYKVIGISGSNGKTSTKEFTRTLLEGHFRCFASQGSFNNHWGVPMSLLAAQPDTEVIVQEMGMNHAGELARLVEIAEPDVVLCTMVGRAHIGELGSQAAVAAAKEELYLRSPQAKQIFNLDNEWTLPMFERAQKHLPPGQVITFSSFNRDADVQMRAESIAGFRLEVSGQIDGVEGMANVPVIGRHNIVNLMAAASIGLAMGIAPRTLWQDLPRCRGAWGRNQLVHLKNGTAVLFDGYNANPESMAALLKNLFEMDVKGKKVAVLGAMMELGHEASRAHRELGELVARSNVDLVWFMGPNKADFEAGLKGEKFSKTYFISDSYEESVAREVGSVLNPFDVAVVKGSRAMEMEKVLLHWQPVDFKNKD
jgi:UDP-N-acetylmuramoyl-tripeptide--D-alanyl-D-alanine ligase